MNEILHTLEQTEQVTHVNIVEDSNAARAYAFLHRLKATGVFPSHANFSDTGVRYSATKNNERHYLLVGIDGIDSFISPKIVWKGKTVKGSGDENKEKWDQLATMRKVVVSGVCLFGGFSAMGLTADGKSPISISHTNIQKLDEDTYITDVIVDSRFHPYEIDYALRILPIIESLGHPSVFHIPDLEYKLNALDVYNQKTMSWDALKKWMQSIDTRSNQVKNLIKNNFTGQTAFKQPLAIIEKEISWFEPLEACVKKLREKDALWKIMLELHKPESFTDIANLSYEYLYFIYGNEETAVIAVEDPTEHKILEKAEKDMKSIPNSTAIIGLYVPSKVIPDARYLAPDTHQDIYYLDRAKLTQQQNIEVDEHLQDIHYRRRLRFA